jgi:hypothetical protein
MSIGVKRKRLFTATTYQEGFTPLVEHSRVCLPIRKETLILGFVFQFEKRPSFVCFKGNDGLQKVTSLTFQMRTTGPMRKTKWSASRKKWFAISDVFDLPNENHRTYEKIKMVCILMGSNCTGHA